MHPRGEVRKVRSRQRTTTDGEARVRNRVGNSLGGDGRGEGKQSMMNPWSVHSLALALGPL